MATTEDDWDTWERLSLDEKRVLLRTAVPKGFTFIEAVTTSITCSDQQILEAEFQLTELNEAEAALTDTGGSEESVENAWNLLKDIAAVGRVSHRFLY